jgi:hypothetical protein
VDGRFAASASVALRMENSRASKMADATSISALIRIKNAKILRIEYLLQSGDTPFLVVLIQPG